jgi:hypothetical protein
VGGVGGGGGGGAWVASLVALVQVIHPRVLGHVGSQLIVLLLQQVGHDVVHVRDHLRERRALLGSRLCNQTTHRRRNQSSGVRGTPNHSARGRLCQPATYPGQGSQDHALLRLRNPPNEDPTHTQLSRPATARTLTHTRTQKHPTDARHKGGPRTAIRASFSSVVHHRLEYRYALMRIMGLERCTDDGEGGVQGEEHAQAVCRHSTVHNGAMDRAPTAFQALISSTSRYRVESSLVLWCPSR